MREAHHTTWLLFSTCNETGTEPRDCVGLTQICVGHQPATALLVPLFVQNSRCVARCVGCFFLHVRHRTLALSRDLSCKR